MKTNVSKSIYFKLRIYTGVVVKIFGGENWVLRCNLVGVPLAVSPIVPVRSLPYTGHLNGRSHKHCWPWEGSNRTHMSWNGFQRWPVIIADLPTRTTGMCRAQPLYSTLTYYSTVRNHRNFLGLPSNISWGGVIDNVVWGTSLLWSPSKSAQALDVPAQLLTLNVL